MAMMASPRGPAQPERATRRVRADERPPQSVTPGHLQHDPPSAGDDPQPPVAVLGTAGGVVRAVIGLLQGSGRRALLVPFDGAELNALIRRDRPEALVFCCAEVTAELLDLVYAVDSRTRPPVMLGVVSSGNARSAALLLTAGAAGCVASEELGAELLTALDYATRGGAWVSPFLLAALLRGSFSDGMTPSPLPQLDALSPREREVLALMAEGLPKPAIAARLNLSVNTVRSHVRSIMTKLAVHSSTAAVSRGLIAALSPAGIADRNPRRRAVERLFGPLPTGDGERF
jgi:DNA-binding NarL/FixJ family response regulator